MAGKNTAVFGIYPDRVSVEEAVEHLRNAGFRGTDVSVLFSDNQGTKDFAHEKNTKAPEGATKVINGFVPRNRPPRTATRPRTHPKISHDRIL